MNTMDDVKEIKKATEGNYLIKNRYARWIVSGLIAAIVGFADSYFFDSLLSGILAPILGIFLGPSAAIGFAFGVGLETWIAYDDLSFIFWTLSALIMAIIPWLFRKKLGDKNKPGIILKYYIVIITSVIPSILIREIYRIISDFDVDDMYYEAYVAIGIFFFGYAIGLPLYYLIRCIKEKDFRHGRMGVHVFCIWMPLQFGICIWFATKAYTFTDISDFFLASLIINIIMSVFYGIVAIFVCLFCTYKRIMLFIFGALLILASVYNIISFDTGFGTYILIVIALWISFHAIFFNFYEREISASKAFKIIVSIAQIILLYTFVLIVALNSSTYIIPEADGDEAGMIILGAPVNDNKASDILLDRIDTAASFLNQNPGMLAIATGGSKVEGGKTEAQIITENLESSGVDKGRIFQETSAKTTQENFENCAKLITSLGGSLDEDFVITTSMFHTLRAGIYARNAGFKKISYLGAHSFAIKSLTWYIREAFSILPLLF